MYSYGDTENTLRLFWYLSARLYTKGTKVMKKLVLPLLISAALFSPLSNAANNQQAISYLTSWGASGITAEEIAQSKMDVIMLAFGKWDASGNITNADGLFDSGSDTYWKPGQYLNWTQAKFNNPGLKVMVAFGGQNDEHLWGNLKNAQERENIAQGLVKFLRKGFPVYKKSGQYQEVGTVYVDGIDFDFEKAARLTEEENSNLLALVKRIRALLGPDSGKLLSLTTYHVGADPVSCQQTVTAECSFEGGSTHHGEVLTLLKEGKHLFDFFNVMTYDAGRNFKYKVAMENYAKAIGDRTKIILGNTINKQWGPDSEGGSFVESRANNIYRAGWQAENNYGGFFVWTLGASTEQLSAPQQVAYLNEMKAAADQASPGEINHAPIAKVDYPRVVTGAVEKVVLDGSASNDPEGKPLTYHWKQVSGSTVTLLSEHDKALFSLNNPAKDEALHFQLEVDDGELKSAPFNITITHKAEQGNINLPPVATIKTVKEVVAGRVVLDGSASSDPEGEKLTWHWEQTGGPRVNLQDADKPKPWFQLNETQQDQTLSFKLTVNDGKLSSVPATATIKHKAGGVEVNHPPIVSVSVTPRELTSGQVILDGSDSWDPENAALKYHWKQTQGTPVSLVGANSAKASFKLGESRTQEELHFSLTVNDATQDSQPKEVIVIHQATEENVNPAAGWQLGKRYNAGDQVKGSDGKIYQCRGDDNRQGWCGIADAYEPGRGWAWRDAWKEVK